MPLLSGTLLGMLSPTPMGAGSSCLLGKCVEGFAVSAFGVKDSRTMQGPHSSGKSSPTVQPGAHICPLARPHALPAALTGPAHLALLCCPAQALFLSEANSGILPTMPLAAVSALC